MNIMNVWIHAKLYCQTIFKLLLLPMAIRSQHHALTVSDMMHQTEFTSFLFDTWKGFDLSTYFDRIFLEICSSVLQVSVWYHFQHTLLPKAMMSNILSGVLFLVMPLTPESQILKV